MKLRITWPVGIVLALAAFVIFILSYVIRVMVNPIYEHHLVSEEYYKDELLYQQEMDKLNNAAALEKDITTTKTKEGLIIEFPSTLDYKKITGHIYFQRTNNKHIDFDLPIIALTSNQFLVDKSKFVDGQYQLKIEWKTPEKEYLYKNKIRY